MGVFGLSKPNFMKSAVEHYRDQLEALMEQKAEIFRNKSIDKKLPNLFTLVFKDYPSDHITAFTFGLCFSSLASEQEFKTELMLQVKSEDINWAHALGFLANHLREQCPFQVGQVLHFGQQIIEESATSDFLLKKPLEQFQKPISVNKKLQIKLVQLEPIRKSEKVR